MGACRAGFRSEGYACLPVFCKNSPEGWNQYLNVLTCSKHPADVIKRRGEALVDNLCCPRCHNPFFLTLRVFRTSQMHLRCLSPPTQTACQNTERRHITAKARPGAAGKVLNVKINLSETSVKPGGEAYGLTAWS